ncbi:MAG: YgfZ/GcvT domain-containing protein [Gammaproteobacteria bacterium]
MTSKHRLPLTVLELNAPSADKVLSFLQGQISCQLSPETPEKASRGAFCDRFGRVVSDAVLVPPGHQLTPNSSWLLVVRQDIWPLLETFLTPYARLSRVAWTLPAQSISVSYAADLTNMSYLDTRRNPDDSSLDICLDTAMKNATQSNWGVRLAPSDSSAQDSDTGAMHQQDQVLRQAAIQAKAPFMLPETSGKFTPHELNYHETNLVHFNKGCYLGQEVIARMQHLGKLKKHFQVLQMPEFELAAGDRLKLASGNQSITVIDSLPLTKGMQLVAACTPDRAIDNGYVLLADQIQAQLVTL